MFHFDKDFVDKNGERYMFPVRIQSLMRDLLNQYCIRREYGTGDFRFFLGDTAYEELNETTPWIPFAAGRTLWGEPDQWAWFRQTVTVPEEFRGEDIWYAVYPYTTDIDWHWGHPQAQLFVNGKCVFGLDCNHRKYLLLKNAKGGETLEIAIKVYSDLTYFAGQMTMSARLQVMRPRVYELYQSLAVPLRAATLMSSDSIERVEMEITSDSDGGTPVEDNSGLYEAEKEAGKAELEAYAEAAYQTADEFQTPRIRRAVTAAKVEICQAATLEELAKLLADAKTEIDTVLATEYEEELEVDYDPDANLEIYYRGSSDLLRILSDYTTEEAPHDQGLTQSVSDDGSHLFWRPGVGDTMSFTVTIPADGAYDLEMPYTCYVDFGMFEVSLDGEKIGETYDAYNADAIITRPAVVKNLNLTKGNHTLTVKCVGKNDSSAGTVLGIDYVRFLGENAVTELDAYKQAAKDSLDTYKDSSGYSTDQWTAVQAEIAKQKALIDGCTAVDDVVGDWKAAKAALDAIPTGMVEYDDLQFDSALTPGDYGWETDGGNYNGWQVVKENEFFDQVFFVEYDGTNSKRIWKDIIEDPDNFTVRFTVKVENWRAEIELMGVHIELNCEHGNGNQIFDRESWNWFDAKDQVCEVTATRENGGDLVFTLVGQGSDTPVVITKTAVNESDQNLYLGVIDATGSAFFHGFEPSEVDSGEPGQNPGEDPGKNPDEPPKTGDPVWAVIALLIVSSLSLTALINKKSLHR